MLRFLGGLLLLVLAFGVLAGLLRPVCVPLSRADLRQLEPSFDENDDHDMLYLKVYQRRDGKPMECKTWITWQVAMPA